MPSSTEVVDDVVVHGVAMASAITVRVVPPRDTDTDTGLTEVRQTARRAFDVFRVVDRTCTRFDASSDLMQANRNAHGWTRVDPHCYDALVEAHAAYRRTHGRFDPRVLDDLTRLGYAESMTRTVPAPRSPDDALRGRAALPAWAPRFRAVDHAVQLGPHPVDLGGIGKGLAVRWATAALRTRGVRNALVEAGGDCYCAGTPGDGSAWRVAVEHPSGGDTPVAVLEVRDTAVATSSVRLRSWSVGERTVHHLVDPSTGLPGGDGLVAVTVVDPDPAAAEVWSKVLFLTGRRGIAPTAQLLGIAALWIDVDGELTASPALAPYLLWTAP